MGPQSEGEIAQANEELPLLGRGARDSALTREAANSVPVPPVPSEVFAVFQHGSLSFLSCLSFLSIGPKNEQTVSDRGMELT